MTSFYIDNPQVFGGDGVPVYCSNHQARNPTLFDCYIENVLCWTVILQLLVIDSHSLYHTDDQT